MAASKFADSSRRRIYRLKLITKKYKNGFFVDLIDYYPEFADNGWYTNSEIETQNWIIDHAKRDWVSFDCGSHIGYYSMLLSYMCPEGRILAFDICDESIKKMKTNIAYNEIVHSREFGNIFMVQTALGDKRGLFKETIWQTGITAGNYGETEGEFSFDTLDGYAQTIKLSKLDFIKIDCDGWDFDILKGAEDTIKKFRPVISMEINAFEYRHHSSKEYFDYLNVLSYNCIPMDDINNLLVPKER